MNIPLLLRAIVPTSLLSFIVLSLPVFAQTDDGASQLLPLETRNVIVEADPNRFKSAEDNINLREAEESDDDDITDFLGAGFLEGLVDENGEVDLPLGITVFDAMGTTSVGFGGEF